MNTRLVFVGFAVLALAGCAQRDPSQSAVETDPAVAQAVIAPILTDPDLVSLDKRFAVMSDPGGLDASLPPDDFAPETIAAAQAEAAALVKGSVQVAMAADNGCVGCDGALLPSHQ